MTKLNKSEELELWQNIAEPKLSKKNLKLSDLRGQSIYALTYPYVMKHFDFARMGSEEMVFAMKSIIQPVIFPNKDIFKVIKMITSQLGLPVGHFKEQDFLQRKRIKKELHTQELD